MNTSHSPLSVPRFYLHVAAWETQEEVCVACDEGDGSPQDTLHRSLVFCPPWGRGLAPFAPGPNLCGQGLKGLLRVAKPALGTGHRPLLFVLVLPDLHFCGLQGDSRSTGGL